MNTHRNAKLIGLFLLGLILFNFPIIRYFSTPYLIFDLPTLFSYIFITWLVIIFAVGRICEGFNVRSGKKTPPENKPADYE